MSNFLQFLIPFGQSVGGVHGIEPMSQYIRCRRSTELGMIAPFLLKEVNQFEKVKNLWKIIYYTKDSVVTLFKRGYQASRLLIRQFRYVTTLNFESVTINKLVCSTLKWCTCGVQIGTLFEGCVSYLRSVYIRNIPT